MRSLYELEAKLAGVRREVRNLTVMLLDPSLSPEDRARLKALERSARAEVKLRATAVEYARTQLAKNADTLWPSRPMPDRNRLLDRHAKALATLHHPDMRPEVKALAKSVKDKTEAALGLIAAMERMQAEEARRDSQLSEQTEQDAIEKGGSE